MILCCVCICGVGFFPGERGRKAGKLHKKAGNTEEEMKTSEAGVTDVRTGELEYAVPCKTFPSILAIFSMVTHQAEKCTNWPFLSPAICLAYNTRICQNVVYAMRCRDNSSSVVSTKVGRGSCITTLLFLTFKYSSISLLLN